MPLESKSLSNMMFVSPMNVRERGFSILVRVPVWRTRSKCVVFRLTVCMLAWTPYSHRGNLAKMDCAGNGSPLLSVEDNCFRESCPFGSISLYFRRSLWWSECLVSFRTCTLVSMPSLCALDNLCNTLSFVHLWLIEFGLRCLHCSQGSCFGRVSKSWVLSQ